MMKDKVYLGIIVLLTFTVIIGFTVEDAKTAELKNKAATSEKLSQTNADLEKEMKIMEEELQHLRTELAMKAAASFKQKQYTVNYVEDYKATYSRQMEEFSDYATNEGLRQMKQLSIIPRIYRLSFETKSNLSVNDITFEVGEFESKDEISFDYEIEVMIDFIEKKNKNRTALNFGQLRVVKTEDGWKVNKDIDRMNGTSVVMGSD